MKVEKIIPDQLAGKESMHVNPRGKRALKILRYCLFAGLGLFLVSLLLPRTYPVSPPVLRESTRYWELSTGSRIAYTRLPGRPPVHPYPILFLQGGPGGPIYDRTIEQLSFLAGQGYDVYLYDQLGCGLSERLSNIKEYSVMRHVADLAAIVDLLDREKVILIGQSWGSMLAVAYMADHPDKVQQAIFTGPGSILPARKALKQLKAPDSLSLQQPIFTNRDGKKKVYDARAGIVEFVAKYLGFKLASDREMDAFADVLTREMSKSTVCDTAIQRSQDSGWGYYSMIRTMQSFHAVPDPRAKLKMLSLPVLILRGSCDGLPWGYASEYQSLFTNSRLVIVPGAGHVIAHEQQERYQQEITGFLSRPATAL